MKKKVNKKKLIKLHCVKCKKMVGEYDVMFVPICDDCFARLSREGESVVDVLEKLITINNEQVYKQEKRKRGKK